MTIEALVARYGLVAIFFGAGLEGETAVVTGGLIAHHHLVPVWAAAIAAVTGSFVADQLFFFAGRRFRDAARIRRIREKPAFAKALALLERHPTGFILVFRFIYGLRTVSPVAIGTSRVPTRTFVVLNAAAATLWGVAFTAIGYFFGNGLERFVGRVLPKDRLLPVAGGVLAAIVVGVAIWRWIGGRQRAADNTLNA